MTGRLGRVGVASLLVCGCAGGTAIRARVPDLEDAKEASCAMVKDHSRPLIVEWPASARGDLEARMKTGLVAVRYVGCAMEVLDRCSAAGTYRYVPFTPKEDRLVIHDKGELYANLPMGAAGLEAKLASTGELDLGMTVVGKYESDRLAEGEADLHGDCAAATHLVTGMTTGAFELSAGGSLDVGAGASVLGRGVKARAVDARVTLSRDGNASACEKAALDDKAPPRGCGGIVRVEVVPVAPPPCPDGSRREGDQCVGDRLVMTRVECPEGATWTGSVCAGRLEAAPGGLAGIPPASEKQAVAEGRRTNEKPAPPRRLPSVFADLAHLEPEPQSRPRRAPPPAPCDASSTADCVTRCRKGSAPSCITLAHDGKKDATYWFVLACENGGAEGCRGVGKAYERGEFGEPDALTAAKWYRMAEVGYSGPAP